MCICQDPLLRKSEHHTVPIFRSASAYPTGGKSSRECCNFDLLMLKYISQIDLEVIEVDILRNILTVVYVINCLVLIVICLMQSKDDEGASGAIVGGSSSSFYEKNKGRTKEGKLKRLTIILGITFVVLTIVLGILIML